MLDDATSCTHGAFLSILPLLLKPYVARGFTVGSAHLQAAARALSVHRQDVLIPAVLANSERVLVTGVDQIPFHVP